MQRRTGKFVLAGWTSRKEQLTRLCQRVRQGWPRWFLRWRFLVGGLSFFLLVALGWGIGRKLTLPAAAPPLVVKETGRRETVAEPETPPAAEQEDLGAVLRALTEEVATLRQRLEQETAPPPEREAEAAPAPLAWLAPVDGKVVRADGWQKQGTEWRYHSGVDLTVSPGTPVRAAAAGKVGMLQTDAALGTVVTLEHGGGWRSLYAHLTRVQVTVGQEVAQGAILGYSAPAACGPEPGIHFNLYQQEDPVNPLAVLSFPPE